MQEQHEPEAMYFVEGDLRSRASIHQLDVYPIIRLSDSKRTELSSHRSSTADTESVWIRLPSTRSSQEPLQNKQHLNGGGKMLCRTTMDTELKGAQLELDLLRRNSAAFLR